MVSVYEMLALHAKPPCQRPFWMRTKGRHLQGSWIYLPYYNEACPRVRVAQVRHKCFRAVDSDSRNAAVCVPYPVGLTELGRTSEEKRLSLHLIILLPQ